MSALAWATIVWASFGVLVVGLLAAMEWVQMWLIRRRLDREIQDFLGKQRIGL